MIVDEYIELNTLSENRVSAARRIYGELKAVIIRSNKNTELEIFMREPTISILSMRELATGDHYLPLKIESRAEDGQLLREDNSYWCFNEDDIVFKIQGSNDTRVEIVMRLEVNTNA